MLRELENVTHDRSKANLANCTSARFTAEVDIHGRKSLVMSSCANWGDVGRVFTSGHTSQGTSYGQEGFNKTLISDEPSISEVDERVAFIGSKCAGLCDGCLRWDPIAVGWPKDLVHITGNRQHIMEVVVAIAKPSSV